MQLPDFSIGLELRGNDDRWYRVLEELNDYFIRAWDYESNKETVVHKELFATY